MIKVFRDRRDHPIYIQSVRKRTHKNHIKFFKMFKCTNVIYGLDLIGYGQPLLKTDNH